MVSVPTKLTKWAAPPIPDDCSRIINICSNIKEAKCNDFFHMQKQRKTHNVNEYARNCFVVFIKKNTIAGKKI